MARRAILFPGQGSQSVGMMRELAQAYPVVQATYDEASQVLGYDLWQLVQEGPSERLNETRCTQPALLAAGVATWRIWLECGGEMPEFMAGHSLGEYTALVCSNAMNYEDAIKLVEDRGTFMQEAVPSGVGGMVAVIGLDDQTLNEVCQEAAGAHVLSAANYNSIGQTVLSGHREAAERAVALSKERGARLAKLLAVSVPSHSPLMQPAAERLAGRLESVSFALPSVCVLHNLSADQCTEISAIKAALVAQLHKPVQWVKTIQAFAEAGVEEFVECGPGSVLSGLNRRITDIPTRTLHSEDDFNSMLI